MWYVVLKRWRRCACGGGNVRQRKIEMGAERCIRKVDQVVGDANDDTMIYPFKTIMDDFLVICKSVSYFVHSTHSMRFYNTRKPRHDATTLSLLTCMSTRACQLPSNSFAIQ